MKTLLAFMLLAAAVLPALSHAQTVNICDRTPQVRDQILQELGANDCAAVDSRSLASLRELHLETQQLSALKAGDFDGLTSLVGLFLDNNRLTTLPAGVFDKLTSLGVLGLNGNRLTTLPAGVFDKLTSLRFLGLIINELTTLPAGVFDKLTSLRILGLGGNNLTTLPAGAFDKLTILETLYLNANRLTTLPAGVFDRLTSLQELDLSSNHLVGLSENDPLFARLPSDVDLRLEGQTKAPGIAAVPLLVSASDSMRQGFVRIMNESEESGSVRILAFDDAGNPANPVVIPLAGKERKHFNSGDLENGNPAKGIESGIGSPTQGDWRLDVETALNVRVLSFIRTNDGFLTAMHDVLPSGRWPDGQRFMSAQTFNPGSNTSQVSKLRLVNIGANAESVRIVGIDDQGAFSGSVSLTLAAGEARTLSAQNLEDGASGLTGTLGDGRGKWDLYVTARESVIGMSLLESPTGHLSNISTRGVRIASTRGDWIATASTGNVPLLAPPRPSH